MWTNLKGTYEWHSADNPPSAAYYGTRAKTFIVCYENGYVSQRSYAFDLGIWLESNDCTLKITHWTELPKPPKEEIVTYESAWNEFKKFLDDCVLKSYDGHLPVFAYETLKHKMKVLEDKIDKI